MVSAAPLLHDPVVATAPLSACSSASSEDDAPTLHHAHLSPPMSHTMFYTIGLSHCDFNGRPSHSFHHCCSPASRVTDAPVGSSVVCLSGTMGINCLGFECTLFTVRSGHVTYVRAGTYFCGKCHACRLQDISSPLWQSKIIECYKPLVQVNDYPEGIENICTSNTRKILPGCGTLVWPWVLRVKLLTL